MRFDVLTLFPELFEAPTQHGVTRRAYSSGAVELVMWPLREFAPEPHRRVDDRPFGGGPGMVMLIEPLWRALDAAQAARAAAQPGRPAAPVIHFSPTGQRMDQALVQRLAASDGAVLLCGRYEGIDQRLLDARVDLHLSLGDFVLSGGELPALALLDAVARLQPGVLGDAQSHEQDSFSSGLLDCPHYSRPERWLPPEAASDDEAMTVPPVLLSGHHGEVARWRRQRSLELTAQLRPDVLHKAREAGQLSPADEAFLKKLSL